MPYGTINADKMTTSDGVSSSGLYGFKNRIINGGMVIDQRNAGAATTPTNSTYLLDRWSYTQVAASKFTFQQNAGSVTPPVGFSNYLGATVASAVTVASGDYYNLSQPIEGFNTADLGFGTANAKTVTLSFQVYSSLTGTFGGSLRNSAGTRSYPFSYSIPTANTWTSISITITGDTTGTWIGATNGVGINVFFGLGVGSTYTAASGSWAAGNYLSATGAVNPIATGSATWYVTGVQLEKGSTATSFDYRPYGTEFALCQRYFQSHSEVIVETSSNFQGWMYPVQMRTAPTIAGGGAGFTINGNNADSFMSFQTSRASVAKLTFSSEL